MSLVQPPYLVELDESYQEKRGTRIPVRLSDGTIALRTTDRVFRYNSPAITFAGFILNKIENDEIPNDVNKVYSVITNGSLGKVYKYVEAASAANVVPNNGGGRTRRKNKKHRKTRYKR